MRPWLVLVAGVFALSCAGQGPATPKPGTLRKGPPPDGRPLLAQDEAKARLGGAGETQVVAVEAATPGDRVSGTLVVPKTSCVLLMARVSDGIDDVDLFAYADDGRVLGSDERTDKRPNLLVCPPHPERVFVVARVASGHGLVAVGGQLVDPKFAARVRRSLGAPPSEEGPGLWARFEADLQSHRAGLGSAWKDVRRAALPLDVAAPTVTNLPIEAGSCLDVFLAPSKEVSHLDVALIDSGGRTLGRAQSLGRDRNLQVCSSEAAEFTLEVRPHLGRGLVALLVSQASSSEAAGESVLRYRAAHDEALPQAVTTAHALNKRLGLQPATRRFEGRSKTGQLTSNELELAAGCTRIDLVQGKPARGLHAWLWSQDGQLVSEVTGDPVARLFACSAGGKFRLDVEAEVRPGPYAGLVASDPKSAAPLRAEPLAASRLLSALAARGVLHGGKQLAGVEAVKLSETALSRRDLYVPPGRCLELALAASAELSELDLSVRSAQGEPLETARGPRVVTTRQCNLQGHGPLRLALELRSQSGSGTALFGWQVLSPTP